MSLLANYDALLLDLDGVVYRGRGAVPHAVEVLDAAVAAGLRLGFVTNNAARPPAEVADHLASLGVAASPDQVVTSAQVGADLLAERIPAGARVLAIGGPGVGLALAERGFEPVLAADEAAMGRSDREIGRQVAGVLQGFGPAVNWHDLAVASYSVDEGAAWVATNTDRTIPRADGIAPGNGTLVAAVTAATGVTPPAAGKPAAAMMLLAAQRLGSSRPLAIGDRLDTDVRGAAAAGVDSLVVLSGVSTIEDVLAAGPQDRPTYLSSDLRGLLGDPATLDGSGVAASGSEQEIADLVRACWQQTAEVPAAAGRIRSLLGGGNR